MHMFDLDNVVPHKRKMRLISDIFDVSEKGISGVVSITKDSLFFEEGQGVPTYIGVEYMAQTISAWANINEKSDKPKVGFLLSCKKYYAHKDYYANGDHLLIKATPVLVDSPISVFDCEIYDQSKNILLSGCRLSVYQNDDIALGDEHAK